MHFQSGRNTGTNVQSELQTYRPCQDVQQCSNVALGDEMEQQTQLFACELCPYRCYQRSDIAKHIKSGHSHGGYSSEISSVEVSQKQKRSYCGGQFIQALDFYFEQRMMGRMVSQRKIAEHFNVPRTTLRDRIRAIKKKNQNIQ